MGYFSYVKKILITDYVDHLLISGLSSAGFKVTYAPELPNKDVERLLPFYHGIIVNTRTRVGKDLMSKAGDLELIGRLGVGLDIIDVDEAERRNIHVVATPGANANAVGEHMFGMMLALIRNIVSADRSVRANQWLRERHRGFELTGKTIGIIGFGNTGSAFAAKFAGWKTKVVSFDKYKERYAADFRYVEETNLQTVIHASDIISLHVPLTEETQHMINRDFLERCKRGVIILNGSRGKVIDTHALKNALVSGHVAGACLDVLENEKPASYDAYEQQLYGELRKMDNVLFTPHIAGWTQESKKNIASQMLESILSIYAQKGQ